MLNEPYEIIEISKEDATFFMDEKCRWCNEGGPISKKSIINYLNRSIESDKKGYYVTHILGNIKEKVYFRYADTALLVTDFKIHKSALQALLNNRRALMIHPENLFIRNDQLYAQQEGHRIKFSEKALVKLSPYLEDQKNELILKLTSSRFTIPEKPNESPAILDSFL